MIINKILITLILILGFCISFIFSDYKNLKIKNKNLNNELIQIKQVRTKEAQALVNLNQKVAEYEQAKITAKKAKQDIINRLNNDNLRLRKQWRNCNMPQTSAPTSAGNGDPENSADLAGAIIYAGLEADIKLKLCQDTIKQYLKLINQN